MEGNTNSSGFSKRASVFSKNPKLKTQNTKLPKIAFTLDDLAKRNVIGAGLLRHFSYERAFSAFCAELLSGFKSSRILSRALRHIVNCKEIDRAWLCKDFVDSQGIPRVSLMAETVADRIGSIKDRPIWKHLPNLGNFLDWRARLSNGEFVSVDVEQLEIDNRRIMADCETKSALFLPVFVDDRWYGFVGLENVTEAIEWDRNDAEIMRTVADMVGIYISRTQVVGRVLSYQNKLRAMASKLLMSEERERRHIATGLHDEVIQPIVFLKLKIERLKKNRADSRLQKELAEMLELITNLLDRTRQLTFDLSCPILHQIGLEAAIKELLKTIVSDRVNIATSFNFSDCCRDLDKNQRIFLYKAVKELLINVVKHANARNVKVSIWAADGNVIISVKDDGKGFDVNDEEKLHFDRYHGFGLFSIRERLVDFAGVLEINSVIGKGTEIIITMPLNQ